MPNLCASVTFNPPVVTLVGATLREETVHKLEQRLPSSTSTTPGANKEAPKFVFNKDPDHWKIDLGQQYCDHLGRSAIYLALIECLEGEDWKLRATNAMMHYDNGKDTNKFFFARN